MNTFKSIDAKAVTDNPFKMIGQDWMLITAEKDGKANTMTASWGGLGVLWNKNVVFIFIRDSRFTKEFVDSADSFSLSVFDHEQYKKMLSYMGSVSGRKEDKIAACGLTVAYSSVIPDGGTGNGGTSDGGTPNGGTPNGGTPNGGTPYFTEAKKVFICRKLYRGHMSPENFIDPSIDSQHYSKKDYHNLYVGEIIEILESE